MIRLLASLHRALLLVALTVALAGTGFAHRLSTPAQDEALAFAVQNGVSLDELCGDDLGKAPHAGAECQACRITGSAGLPVLTGLRIDLELAFHAAVTVPLESHAVLHLPDPAHRPQGPPVA